LAKKSHSWANGAVLDEHSRYKHRILSRYFHEYLLVRSSWPQRRLRLVIFDAFAGGGEYNDGSKGSPLIFLSGLRDAYAEINAKRMIENLPALELSCLLVLNDNDPEAVALLRQRCGAALAEIQESAPLLEIKIEYRNEEFLDAWNWVKQKIDDLGFTNVLANLDQYGHSAVKKPHLDEIMRCAKSVEIFLTFAIQALRSYLSLRNPDRLDQQLKLFELSSADIFAEGAQITKAGAMGVVEREVYNSFLGCAQYVSPFSINNPNGWRYWLLHFSNHHRARQVYNDVLHLEATQAHFGRFGLNMLGADPSDENSFLYEFDGGGRTKAKEQLIVDLPRFIARGGDCIRFEELLRQIYNETPAHSMDIRQALIQSDELEVWTAKQSRRRKPTTLRHDDVITVTRQTHFLSLLKQ
jgi:three-Cys-motif partner protein